MFECNSVRLNVILLGYIIAQFSSDIFGAIADVHYILDGQEAVINIFKFY